MTATTRATADDSFDRKKPSPHDRDSSHECDPANVAATAAVRAARPRSPDAISQRSLERHVIFLEDRFKELKTAKDNLKEDNKSLNRQNFELQDENKELLDANKTLLQKNIAFQKANERHFKNSKELEQRYEDIQGCYNYIVEKYIWPYADKQKMGYNLNNMESLEKVLAPLLEDALNAGKLQEQVHSLQISGLANVQKVQPVSDEQFRRDFGELASLIKSFSRAIKLPSGADIANIVPVSQCTLLYNVQKEHWNSGSRKKGMIEAYIWSVLIESILNNPFFIFGELCQEVGNQFLNLYGSAHDHDWPIPCELSERWKYTTIESLLDIFGKEAIINGIPNGGASSSVRESMTNLREGIQASIESTFTSLSPKTDFYQLQPIINKSISLALQMSLQRCRVQIVWPAIGEAYVLGETIHLSSISDSEDVEEGNVAFIVNPGLAKWGDAYGKKLEQRLDIVPSMVFVEARPKEILQTVEEHAEKLDNSPQSQFKIPNLIDGLESDLMDIDHGHQNHNNCGTATDTTSQASTTHQGGVELHGEEKHDV
jgi:hypothetical protein